MKICFVVHVGLPHVGGSEIFVHELAKAMRDLGHDAVVLTSNGSHKDYYDVEQVQYVPIPVNKDAYRRHLGGMRQDVTIIFGTNVWPESLFEPEWGFPYVWIPCFSSGNGLSPNPNLEQKALAVIGINPGEKEYATDWMQPGLNTLDYEPVSPQPLPSFPYIYVPTGTWPHKQVDRLADVLHYHQIVVTGSGPRISLPANVTNLGQRPPEQVAWLYKNCKLVATGSKNEQYGFVFTESMAHGKCYVSFDVGLARSMDGGFVAPIDDWDLFKAFVDVLWVDTPERTALEKLNTLKVSSYSWASAADTLNAILDRKVAFNAKERNHRNTS
jgi:glycosyltransferase involved in cell wall biosynthesis